MVNFVCLNFPRVSVVKMNPPVLKFIKERMPGKLEYPEDQLRNKFFEVYPETRQAPINPRALSMPNRHISDKFVHNQMLLLKKGISVEKSFEMVSTQMANELRGSSAGTDIYASLLNPRIKDYYTRVFMASWADSSRDKFLYKRITGDAPRGLEITLEDVLRPSFATDYAEEGDTVDSEEGRDQNESTSDSSMGKKPVDGD
mmetsp:Transcript_20365/g.82236  ORF Transcript_20365/g.82236 Transcript_20365/m.82236 type:complete len:201 (-) Transcript_20365:3360-3962(-)